MDRATVMLGWCVCMSLGLMNLGMNLATAANVWFAAAIVISTVCFSRRKG